MLQTPSKRSYTSIFNIFVSVLTHSTIYVHYPIPIVKKFYGKERWISGKDETIFNYDIIDNLNGFHIIVNTSPPDLKPAVICYGENIFCNVPDGCGTNDLAIILTKLALIIMPNDNINIVEAFGDIAAYLINVLTCSLDESTQIIGNYLTCDCMAPAIIGRFIHSRCTTELSEHLVKTLRDINTDNVQVRSIAPMITRLFDDYDIIGELMNTDDTPYVPSLLKDSIYSGVEARCK